MKSQYSNFKFRPSMLPKLMTGANYNKLGATTQSALLEIFIATNFGREKIITTKFMEKGISQEDTSISLYRKVNQVYCIKNEDRLSNDFLVGTPDLILDDKVVDIKTSWDVWTFMKSNEKSARADYYWQLAAYMLLTGKTKSELAYCLVDNSEFTIYSELRQLQFSLGLNEISDNEQIEKLEEQIRRNNTYSDIPARARIRAYEFELGDGDRELIETQLEMCRRHLMQLENEYRILTHPKMNI